MVTPHLESWLATARSANAGNTRLLAIGAAERPPVGLLSGSFHPLHAGHRGMAERASELLGGPVDFELSIANADKPPLTDDAVAARLRQDFGSHQVWLSNAASFADKASLFPGTTFVLGVDTLARIADLRFYQDLPSLRARAIEAIATADCRFLVFARQVDGTVQQADQLRLPPDLNRLCRSVSPKLFLSPLSSTQIRSPS